MMKRKHEIAGTGCAACLLGLLSAAGYLEAGRLPVWGFIPLAILLLAGAVTLCQLTAKWRTEARRQQRRAELSARIDKVKEERENHEHVG